MLELVGSPSEPFILTLRERPHVILCILQTIKNILNHGSKECKIPPNCSDFRICIKQQSSSWTITVLSCTRVHGPVKAARCMSCDMECPLITGLLGSEAKVKFDKEIYSIIANDSLISSTLYSRCFLDAKARSKLIITPKRHVRSIFYLSELETLDLFKSGVNLLQDLHFSNFSNIVLNHGQNQNHSHLHMKISVGPSCRDISKIQFFQEGNEWFGDWLRQTSSANIYAKYKKIKEWYREVAKIKNILAS